MSGFKDAMDLLEVEEPEEFTRCLADSGLPLAGAGEREPEGARGDARGQRLHRPRHDQPARRGSGAESAPAATRQAGQPAATRRSGNRNDCELDAAIHFLRWPIDGFTVYLCGVVGTWKEFVASSVSFYYSRLSIISQLSFISCS